MQAARVGIFGEAGALARQATNGTPLSPPSLEPVGSITGGSTMGSASVLCCGDNR